MKISILWAGLSSFSVSFFRELAQREGCRLQLVYQPPVGEAPYEAFDLGFCEEFGLDAPERRPNLAASIRDFAPDCLVVCGWLYPHYLELARRLRQEGALTVCSLSNPWLGSLRQRIGVLLRRRYLHQCFDAMLVPGDRAAQFAERLGFSDVLYGVNCADVSLFACATPVSTRPRAFLFAGRLVHEKGFDLLLAAFREYRSLSRDPAELLIAGTGPYQSRLAGLPGVRDLGFLQPAQLAGAMRKAWCLVLPSRYEPWGVVLHEAAAAGLPIIASDRCGAVPQLVRDGENGFVIAPRAPDLLTALSRFDALSNAERDRMGGASRVRAGQWIPENQGRAFVAGVTRLLGSPARARWAASRT